MVLSSTISRKRIGADLAKDDHRSYSACSGRSSRIMTCVLGESAVALKNESPKLIWLLKCNTSMLNAMAITSHRSYKNLAVRSHLAKIVKLNCFASYH